MEQSQPEKIRLLKILNNAGFDVPDFVYLTAEDFMNENFGRLKDFFKESAQGFKVIVMPSTWISLTNVKTWSMDGATGMAP